MDQWQRNRSKLYALAAAVIGDSSRVDDVLQEAFARLLRAKRTFSNETEAVYYMRAAVTNTAIDWYRRNRRYSSTFKSGVTAVHDCSIGSTPLELLLRKESARHQQQLLARLRMALDQLPAEDRVAVDAYFGEQRRPLHQICRELGISYGKLRYRLFRAIDRIRGILREEGFQELSWCLEEEPEAVQEDVS